jgi:hypothetical protein
LCDNDTIQSLSSSSSSSCSSTSNENNKNLEFFTANNNNNNNANGCFNKNVSLFQDRPPIATEDVILIDDGDEDDDSHVICNIKLNMFFTMLN